MSLRNNMLALGIPLRPSNLSQPVNHNVHIRMSSSPEQGIGLFASHRISKGLKILSEEPLLLSETRDDMIDGIGQEFATLPPGVKAIITRFHAGQFDMVPLMTVEHIREQQSMEIGRLQAIVQLNSLEGAGIGCVISPSLAAVNHQ